MTPGLVTPGWSPEMLLPHGDSETGPQDIQLSCSEYSFLFKTENTFKWKYCFLKGTTVPHLWGDCSKEKDKAEAMLTLSQALNTGGQL